MLVVFPPTFVVDTKKICGYKFVAPLRKSADKTFLYLLWNFMWECQNIIFLGNMIIQLS